MKNREMTKRDLKILVFCLLLLIFLAVGGSFAYINATVGQKDQNKVVVGTLEITYDDTSSGYGNMINLASALPISDTDGRNSTGYKFKITNIGTIDATNTFNTNAPWLCRGARYNNSSASGVFAYDVDSGGFGSGNSTRIIQVPLN